MNKIIILAGVTLLLSSLVYLNNTSETQTDDMTTRFQSFTQTYNKKYGSTEQSYRLAIYTQNMLLADFHNSNPESTWVMGETQFSDLTQDEFVAIYLTFQTDDLPQEYDQYKMVGVDVATSVDWRTQAGVASKVKNQGNCGSCWAFSAVGAVEAYYATVKGEKGLDLSEQQMVDCSTANYGCDGGFNNKALDWVAKSGLTTTSKYAYKGVDQTCKISTGAYKITKAQKVTASNVGLQQAVESRPVSVCVDATNWSSYKSGIFSNCAKSTNHCVLAFGYTQDHWLIKNSWGTSWGESGFMRLAMGNTCNVLSEAYLAA